MPHRGAGGTDDLVGNSEDTVRSEDGDGDDQAHHVHSQAPLAAPGARFAGSGPVVGQEPQQPRERLRVQHHQGRVLQPPGPLTDLAAQKLMDDLIGLVVPPRDDVRAMPW
ncbi:MULTISPECIES: hypothetical protein [unclassified Streptomyces]|uniref:hypothetical protein n=1 Tax=Streptomyces sp. NPDC055082 TaxID=3365718 RepID=UPI0037CE3F35